MQAVLLMVISGACYAGMAAIIKWLADSIHPLEMVFFRNLFGLAAVLPFFFRNGSGSLNMRRAPVFLIRGIVQASAQTLFYFGIVFATLAAAVTLSMTQGFILAIGAVVFLGEPSQFKRWLAVIAGMAGALMVVRPDAGLLAVFLDGETTDLRALGAALVVLSTVGYAALSLNGKVLVRTLPIPGVITGTLLFSTPLTFIAASFVWTWPSLVELAALAAMGGLGTAGNATLTRALKMGDVTILAPLIYVRLVWGALFGFVLFAEIPGPWTAMGAALIIGAGVYMSRLEANRTD